MMTNQEIAESFLQLASSGQVDIAYDRYVANHFKHHNQYFKGDRDSLAAAMSAAHKSNPNKAIEIRKTYVDGETVITHSRVVRANPEDPAIAVIHIFRFEDGKIAELWDIGQLIETQSPNENGLFSRFEHDSRGTAGETCLSAHRQTVSLYAIFASSLK